jgi:LysR family transcriptional regulator, glycine cleavage system transcriptional activator
MCGMARRLPSLNALRAFEAAARHVSFSLAAAELGVTHAAVSRHIRDLELRLGVKLFHRTGRGVELTDDGEAYARDLTPAFDLLLKATERFPAPRGHQQLVISSEVPFAALWLVPRLGRFTAKNSEIELVLDPTNRMIDFSKNEADLGIRYGRGTWPGVEAIKLFDSEVTPVCSPAHLKKVGIKTPLDLKSYMLIQEDARQHWSSWLKAADAPPTLTAGGPTLRGHLAIAAAEAGQGFALADSIQAGDALIAKRLVRPFALSVADQAYYLVRAAGSKESKVAAAFRTWLVSELAQFSRDLASIKGKPRA